MSRRDRLMAQVETGVAPSANRRGENGERAPDHPAIDQRHQPITFRRGNEMAGRNQLPRLVAQPQQQFDMQSAILALAAAE